MYRGRILAYVTPCIYIYIYIYIFHFDASENAVISDECVLSKDWCVARFLPYITKAQ